MAIRRLSQSAVESLGATQVLTSPVALVKELVDNALDAGASSVSIQVSANALDIIRVRDNGHGIAPDDRPLVAKHSCTSKIRDLTDLAVIGGASLGFRGESLHSAAEISHGLSIVTRVQGEPLATVITFNKDGSIKDQNTASDPFGTSVEVTGFLDVYTVRRNVMIRDASKNLAAVKKMLQSYAFARPKTRISLKILRAASSKDDWTYATKPGASMVEDAMRIVGKTCIMQCTMQQMAEHGFSIRALLPKPDAEPSKIIDAQFITIDGRPISASRGIGSRIVRVYKDCLRASSHPLVNMRSPFVHISLTCPTGSYDANIEPAKDDVLFGDETTILELMRRMFERCFPKRQASTLVGTEFDFDVDSRPAGQLPVGEESAASDWSARASAPSGETIDGAFSMSEGSILPRRMAGRTLLATDLDDCEHEDVRRASISNPWTIAKMNSYRQKFRPAASFSSTSPPPLNPVDTPMAHQNGCPVGDVSSPGARAQHSRAVDASDQVRPQALIFGPHGAEVPEAVGGSAVTGLLAEVADHTSTACDRMAQPGKTQRFASQRHNLSLPAQPARQEFGSSQRTGEATAAGFIEPADQDRVKASRSTTPVSFSLARISEEASRPALMHKKGGDLINKPFKIQVPGRAKKRPSAVVGPKYRRRLREVYESCNLLSAANGTRIQTIESAMQPVAQHGRPDQAEMTGMDRDAQFSAQDSLKVPRTDDQFDRPARARTLRAMPIPGGTSGYEMEEVSPPTFKTHWPQTRHYGESVSLRNPVIDAKVSCFEEHVMWGIPLDPAMSVVTFARLERSDIDRLIGRLEAMLSEFVVAGTEASPTIRMTLDRSRILRIEMQETKADPMELGTA